LAKTDLSLLANRTLRNVRGSGLAKFGCKRSGESSKNLKTEGIEIGKIYVIESRIYQVGIREILYIFSLHLGGRSEKKVMKADRPFYPAPQGNPTTTPSWVPFSQKKHD